MNKYYKTVLLLLISTCFSTLTFSQDNIITKEIKIKEFDKMIVENPGTIVDVRTKGEVAKGVIPGSVNIDFFDDDFKSKINKLDKSKPIYVYCASGGRSGESVEIFAENGFKEIYDLTEGYGAYSKINKKK